MFHRIIEQTFHLVIIENNLLEIFFTFQKTGIPLQVAARLQLNLLLQPISDVT